MRQYPGFEASFVLPLKIPNLTLQSALIHVPADSMVDLHHWRQCALSEAHHRTQRELIIRSSQRHFVSFAGVLGIIRPQSEVQAQSLQQAARPARMARGSTAYAYGVVAL